MALYFPGFNSLYAVLLLTESTTVTFYTFPPPFPPPSKKIFILEFATSYVQPTILMLFICLIFPVYPHFSFMALYPLKLLEEGTGGHICESVWPFKLVVPATCRGAHLQVCSPVSTVEQTWSAHSADKADSVKPR